MEAVIEGGAGGTARERRAEAFVVNCKVGGTVVFGGAAYSRGWTTFARACQLGKESSALFKTS